MLRKSFFGSARLYQVGPPQASSKRGAQVKQGHLVDAPPHTCVWQVGGLTAVLFRTGWHWFGLIPIPHLRTACATHLTAGLAHCDSKHLPYSISPKRKGGSEAEPNLTNPMPSITPGYCSRPSGWWFNTPWGHQTTHVPYMCVYGSLRLARPPRGSHKSNGGVFLGIGLGSQF